MIGAVTFPNGARAILGDNLRWSCEDEGIEQALELYREIDLESIGSSASVPRPGRALLEIAAKRYGGTVDPPDDDEDEPPTLNEEIIF